MIKLSGEVGYTVTLEVEVVHVDIQTLAVVDIKLLLGVLQKEGGLSDTSRTFDANEPVAPVDFVHQGAAYWCVGMLDEISVRPEKSLHLLSDLFRFPKKVVQRYTFFANLQTLSSKISFFLCIFAPKSRNYG